MIINTVTFTGADDFVDPEEMLAVSLSSPLNVEWAILFSQSKSGVERYPSLHWVESLLDLVEENRNSFNIAAHLCGKWVDDALNGKVTFLEEERYRRLFGRIQFNLSKDRLGKAINNPEFMNEIQRVQGVDRAKPVILGGNWSGVDQADLAGKFFPLFDASGGRGIETKVWPEPFKLHDCPVYSGYAGGLGPDNLREELAKINSVVRSGYIWIDMESKIRTNEKFDLEKCKQVLEIVNNCVIDDFKL